MKKNNFGISYIYIILILAILIGIGVGYYYYFLKNSKTQITSDLNNKQENLKSKKTEINNLNIKVIIYDYINGYSIEVDTSKTYSFPNYFKKNNLDQNNVTFLEKSIAYNVNEEEGTFTFSFSPNQNIIISEGSESYGIESVNGAFDPKEYWGDYLGQPRLNFKYHELEVNGFKAYTTSDIPGRGLSVNTIVVINPNHYVILNYQPYMADTTEFDNPNYNLKTSKEPVIQGYFDTINSLKKLR